MTNILSSDMIRNLLRSKDKSGRSKEESVIGRWPGVKNTIRLAKAVEAEAPVVVFENGKSFDIKYKERVILIRPSTGEFAPMGFFTYAQLKEAKTIGSK